MSWSEVIKSLVFWGPGAVLAVCMIAAIYKLADKFIDKFAVDFINVQKAQAESLGKMAQGAEGVRASVDVFTHRDSTEHQEILLLLRYVAQHQELFMKTTREHEARTKDCGGD